jgi:hypothetical protein
VNRTTIPLLPSWWPSQYTNCTIRDPQLPANAIPAAAHSKTGLRPLDRCYRGFEWRWGHWCSSFVVWRVGGGSLITRSEDSYRVCDLQILTRGGPGPRWAVESQGKHYWDDPQIMNCGNSNQGRPQHGLNPNYTPPTCNSEAPLLEQTYSVRTWTHRRAILELIIKIQDARVWIGYIWLWIGTLLL